MYFAYLKPIYIHDKRKFRIDFFRIVSRDATFIYRVNAPLCRNLTELFNRQRFYIQLTVETKLKRIRFQPGTYTRRMETNQKNVSDFFSSDDDQHNSCLTCRPRRDHIWQSEKERGRERERERESWYKESVWWWKLHTDVNYTALCEWVCKHECDKKWIQ
jgi:hypothetical protein